MSIKQTTHADHLLSRVFRPRSAPAPGGASEELELRELVARDRRTLESFVIPPKGDNALTWAIRHGRRAAFEYLLHSRHLSPALANARGHNAIHFALRTGRLAFLAYLLEERYL